MKDNKAYLKSKLKQHHLEMFETKLIQLIDFFKEFKHYNKILTCGNGGSAADSSHVVGELMKQFTLNRTIDVDVYNNYKALYGIDDVLNKTQGTIRAISLSSEISLLTAIANDIGYDYVFSQQVYGYGDENDILFAFSTSGNSQSVINACKMAKAKKMMVVGFTGKTGGKMLEHCDLLFNVDSTDTMDIQQQHEVLYHIICEWFEIERFL